jgi:hypothetical protein
MLAFLTMDEGWVWALVCFSVLFVAVWWSEHRSGVARRRASHRTLSQAELYAED